MRARNIKPAFFKNELLGSMPAEARLLFIGLWCLADREGRLEDREKRIEAEIFPYEKVDTEMHMQALASTNPPFIIRYSNDKNRYIQIVNFLKHQNPNDHEKRSLIPSLKCNALSRNSNATLNPESPSLNPEPPIVPQGGRNKPREWFEKTWLAYPKERRQGKDVAFKRYQKAVKTLDEAKQVARALESYLKSNVVKDGFIMRASKWFAEWEDWKDDDTRNSQGVPGAAANSGSNHPGPRGGGFVAAGDVLGIRTNLEPVRERLSEDETGSPGD